MYAIIETGGKQYRVEEGAKLTIDRLDTEEGKSITFDKVLLVGGDKGTKIGTPIVKGAGVTAKVVSHDRGDKVTNFKYKRRHRYRRKVGFRSSLTTVEITGIKG